MLGPILYILVTLAGQSSATFEDFYFAQRKIKPDEFISSTVMYSLQVAAITLFATWGYLYGIWVVMVPLFWGLGYIIIVWLINNGYVDEFLKGENTGTIHQFIGEKSDAKEVAALAALCSLIGISGPALFEAEFVGSLVSNLVANALSSSPDINIISKYSDLLFVALIGFACVYMLFGGFRALVKTDEIQLSIGFSLFSIFLALILFHVASLGYSDAALILSVIAVIVCLAVVLHYLLVGSKSLKLYSCVPVIVSLISFIICMVASFIFGSNTPDSEIYIFDALKLDQPLGLGVMSIISLLIANILYQIVDVGQWQRLLSVEFDESEMLKHKAIITASLARTGLYSSASWVLAILFGISLNFVGSDIASNPYDAVSILLLNYQEAYGVFGQAIVLIFLLAIVAIAMSTLDSLISSITFTIHNDWIISFNENLKSQVIARFSTLIYIIIAITIYKWLSDRVESLADILYCCWAFQIALLPTIIGALKGNRGTKYKPIISIVFGVIGALLPLFFDSLDPYQYSPTLSLIFSVLGYMGVSFVNGEDKYIHLGGQDAK